MQRVRKAWKPYGVVALWLMMLSLAALPIFLQRGCRLVELSRLGSAGGLETRTMRGLWVTRWDYRTEDDIRRIMREASANAFTDLFWQVRGQADAFYVSGKEVWGEQLLANGRPPTFDPLTVAVREAHARGIRIHAWANVMPLWKGTQPPQDRGHIYYTHPEWRLRDQSGKEQALNEGYVIVNPVLDEVQAHIASVFGDIARRYDVDAIHMDYVRFVAESVGEGLWPGDEQSLREFYRDTGRSAVRTREDREAHAAWVRGKITALVKQIRREVKGARPGIELSAAVWRRPDLGSDTYLQDAGDWLRTGLIDRALPMIYTDKDDQLMSDITAWLDVSTGAPVTPGIGVYKHEDPDQTIRQILMVDGADGYSLFGYASLFESVDPTQDKSPAQVELRRKRRDRVGELQRATGR